MELSFAEKVNPQPVIKAFERELTDTSKKALSEFRKYVELKVVFVSVYINCVVVYSLTGLL